jgi:UDP-N-acetyl-D-galactosamine dehydrogenase
LKQRIDRTGETAPQTLSDAIDNGLIITDNDNLIKDSDVFIVTVPTPVDANNRPDLAPLIAASRTVGNVIRKGNVVIFESTVYPGVTEEVCVPEIEKASGLKFNIDFYAGYSPERINPGDNIHTVEKIVKVTSGSTPEIAKFVDSLYNSVLKNGTFPVSSIRIAEASKIIENSQRDVNIAFMNELAKIFNAMGIDTNEVIDAAATKWNFIKMRPGLVGGHCIGVDPYYLIQKAQVYGIMPRVMMAARRLNDGMGEYVANQVIKLMNLRGIMVKDAKILLLGFTFKENCRDIRNTKVADIYFTFHQYTQNISVIDPWADAQQVNEKYGIKITKNATQNTGYDAIVLCVAHDNFKDLKLREMLKPSGGIVYDVKGFLPQDAVDGRL